MTAVRAPDVEAALRRLDPRIVVLLFYGPDTGLVAERARKAAEQAVADPADPFQLVRLEGETVAADPGRLADEAGTIGLFGGRRAVWVRPTTRNLAPTVEAILQSAPKDALVVIEAGDLPKSSPLRTLCEKSPAALALPCYADSARELGAIIDETLRGAGLSIAKDARAALLASLGGDRLASRSEVGKLALYAHGRREVTLDDVDAVVSDVSALALDALVDAAFCGDRIGIEAGCRRVQAEGTAPSVVLTAALRHTLALLAAAADIDEGRSAEAVLQGWRGLHFRRRDLVAEQLRRWRATSLAQIVALLQSAVLDSRRSDLAQAIVLRTLFQIAGSKARSERAA
jgi:DNA polymerase-3 subunit delta